MNIFSDKVKKYLFPALLGLVVGLIISTVMVVVIMPKDISAPEKAGKNIVFQKNKSFDMKMPDIYPSFEKTNDVKKTSKNTDSITLSWSEVKYADGYTVRYKSSADDNDYNGFLSVKEPTCTIEKLEETTTYDFKLAPYIIINGVAFEGEALSYSAATETGSVEWVNLLRCSSVVELEWSKVDRVSGYDVFRKADGDKDYKLIKTLKGEKSTNYDDESAKKGTVYTYSVKAFQSVGKEKQYGEEKQIRVKCGLGGPDFKISSQLSKISLNWDKNKYADGFDIYYTDSDDNPYQLLTTTTDNYYTTKELTVGKMYYFRVQPFANVGKDKERIDGTYCTNGIKVSKYPYGDEVGNTYIEVSISKQHMWFYIDGKVYIETDVVTGNKDGSHDTPTGIYTIFQRTKGTYLVGSDYRTYVNYWLGFTSDGVGIHDSTWRSGSEYGGSTYKGNGSHGCVNTPIDKVKKIYDKAKIGTHVVVHK